MQRAIGELMISVPVTGDDSFDCIGYATFCTRLQSDAQFAAWLRRVEPGLKGLASCEGHRTKRLVELHSRLTDLVEFLDEKAVRFPSRLRDRLELPPPPEVRHASQAG